MKKMWKKMIAILLVVIMIGGAAPLGALAEMDWSCFPRKTVSSWCSVSKDSVSLSSIVSWITNNLHGLSLHAKAENYSGSCGPYLSWAFDSVTGLLNITGHGTMRDYTQVYQSGGSAFNTNAPWNTYRDMIQTVMIGDQVTSIGEYAFFGCESLTHISLPDNLRYVGRCALFGCSKLTSITIPDSVNSIGSQAFSGVGNVIYSGSLSGQPWGARCWNGYVEDYFVFESADKTTLSVCGRAAEGSVSIPDGVKLISQRAFWNCSGISSVTIPNSVTTIGDAAFDACSGLTSLIIPDSVTTIGIEAFSSCTSLTCVTISNSVTNIDNRTFFGCIELESITIPNSVKHIGNYSFSDCSSLVEVKIGNGVTSIGEHAFSNCIALTGFTIPNNVKSLGDSVLGGCTHLENLTLPFIGLSQNATEEDAVFGVLFGRPTNGEYAIVKQQYADNVNAYITCYFPNSLHTVTITNPCTEIPYGAFYNCWFLKKIIIPNGLTKIGRNSFYNCNTLNDVIIPNSVETIESLAFYNCSCLSKITLSTSLRHIGIDAFYGTALYTDADNWTDGVLYIDNALITTNRILSGTYAVRNGTVCLADNALKGCGNLAVLDIPESVLGIGIGAFDGCKSLAEICVAAENLAYCSDVSGVLYNKAKTVLLRCPAQSAIDNYVLTQGVLRIEDDAFSECANLLLVDLPNSVRAIGNSAFENCENLSTVRFSAGLLKIGDSSFKNCCHLQSIDLPDCVSEIGENAFYGCYRQQYLHIPASLSVIRTGTFAVCALKSISLGDNIEIVEEGAFNYNPIRNITFGSSVKQFGGSTSGFSGYYFDGRDPDYNGLESVCYSGTVEQWLATDFSNSYGSDNPLTSAPRYYHTHDDSMRTEVRNAKEATCDIWVVNRTGYTGDVVYLPCGAIKDVGKVIPAPDHNYVTTEVPATCETNGQVSAICSRCGLHNYDTESRIPPLGHDWNDGVVTHKPTCTESGIITYTCKRDASHTREEYTPAKGHVFGGWQETKAPTVDSTGLAQRRCSVCGDVETITLAKLPAPEKLTLNKTSVTLNYKDSETLTASEAVTWTSSNEKVVIVDATTGKLTTVGKGTATVTAHSVQGDKTATCEVTVKYTFIQILIRIFLFGFIWY